MEAEELSQFEYISKMTTKVYEMYDEDIITKEQIGKVWNKLAMLPNIPNMWPSRILEKTKRVDMLEDEFGENWDKILGMFVESPSYLINYYCPENNIDFSKEYFKKIDFWIEFSARTLKMIGSESNVNFEGMI